MTSSKSFRPIPWLIGTFLVLSVAAVWAEESSPKVPETTRIAIQTTGPVAYRHFYTPDPPQITFRFLTETVYSSMQESVLIQRGIVKEIQVDYFQKKAAVGGRRPVKQLVFTLLAPTTYEVFEGPNTITLSIQNPKGMEASIVPGKVFLTTLSASSLQDQRRKEELTRALEQSLSQKRARPQRSTAVMTKASSPAAAAATSSNIFRKLATDSRAFVAMLLTFLLGGLFWPSRWPSLRFPAQRRERERGWEMAKRLMGLKEEMAAKDSRFAEEIASHQKQERFLTSQISYLKEINQELTQKSQQLLEEQRQLRRELEKRNADVDELVLERNLMMDRLEALQRELDETKVLQEQTLRDLEERLARLDQEVAKRQELEKILEGRETMVSGTQQERRQWERLSISSLGKRNRHMAVEVQGPGGRIIYGFPRDLGNGGLAFELKEKVDLSDPVSLKLHFPNREGTLEATGRVAWRNDEASTSRYGVSFDSLPHGTDDFIRQFVRNHLIPRQRSEKIQDVSPVRFQYHAPQAEAVSVGGDFNQWDPVSHPMQKSEDGTWTLTLGLSPGTYHYKFFVDGRWEIDPSASKRAPDPFGGENTILDVT